MTRAEHRQRWFSLAYGFFLVFIFTVLGTGILLIANGYRINVRTWSIEATGAIVVAGTPTTASTTLDGLPVGTRLPLTLRFVSVGTHSVQVTAPNRHVLHRSVRIEPSQAAIYDQITLWLTTPITIPFDQPPALPDTPLNDPTLAIDGLELFQLENGQRQLVTRFSEPILSATRSNDRAHIFVQLDQRIYVTELDGSNTTKLLELNHSTPTPIIVRANDTQLVIRDGDTVQIWQIR